MSMWIRSQNKEVLAKCKAFYLSEHVAGEHRVCEATSSLFLGIYKTHEKAIEVLDGIEHLLCTDFKSVYDMPEV